MRKLGLTLLLMLFTLPLHDGPVPYVLRSVISAAKPKSKPVKQEVLSRSDSECLASVIYHEARGEPLEGQRAVYDVVMHRVKVLRKSVCGVVTAPKQFSWYGDPSKPIMPLTRPMSDLLKRVKEHPKVLDSINFRWFFSGEKLPYWAKKMNCHKLGGHRFCKEEEKDNGSTREVRDSGEGAQEVSERDHRSRIHDI